MVEIGLRDLRGEPVMNPYRANPTPLRSVLRRLPFWGNNGRLDRWMFVESRIPPLVLALWIVAFFVWAGWFAG